MNMTTLFGFQVPEIVPWIIGIILVVGVIFFILKGFIEEIRKKK